MTDIAPDLIAAQIEGLLATIERLEGRLDHAEHRLGEQNDMLVKLDLATYAARIDSHLTRLEARYWDRLKSALRDLQWEAELFKEAQKELFKTRAKPKSPRKRKP